MRASHQNCHQRSSKKSLCSPNSVAHFKLTRGQPVPITRHQQWATKRQIRRREGLRVTHGRTARDRGERERARTRTDAMASESDPLRAVALEGRLGAHSHDPLAREKNAVRLSFLTTPFPLPPLLSPRRLHAGRAVGHPRAPEAPGAAVRYAEGRRVRAFAAPRARRRAVVSQATAGARREAIEGQRRPEVVDRGGPRE